MFGMTLVSCSETNVKSFERVIVYYHKWLIKFLATKGGIASYYV